MEIVSREINLPDSCTVKSLTERYEKMWADPAHAQPLVTFAFIPDASVDRRAVLDDPAAMLDMALGVLEKNLSVPNDFIPMVRVEMGSVMVATAFGAEIMMNRNSPPAVLTHPIQSREDLEKAGRPDFRVAGLFPKAFEHIAYFREHLPEGVRQCHVDLQGPWNTAQLLGGNEIFLQIYDDPELVGQMMDRVGEVMIAAVPEIKKAIGEEADCFYLQGLKFQGGCRACNCSTDMISGDYYEEWVLPQDIRYFNAVGGGMIHICGNNSHCIRHFNKINNLHALEVAFNSLDIFKVADMLREDIVLVCTGPVEPPLLTPLGHETLEKLSRGILPDKKNLLFHFNDPADIDKCRTLYDGIYGAAR